MLPEPALAVDAWIYIPAIRPIQFLSRAPRSFPSRRVFWERCPTVGGCKTIPFCRLRSMAITQPPISRSSLDGNVQPLMINATLVNNAIDRLNLKAYYRYYNLDNNSKSIAFNQGIVVNDTAGTTTSPNCPPAGLPADAGTRSIPYQYSTQNLGMEAGYDFTRWISTKFVYNWQRRHTDNQDVLTSDEFTIGPTVDIKPTNWVLFRAAYKHSWRNAPDYNNNRKRWSISPIFRASFTWPSVTATRSACTRKFHRGNGSVSMPALSSPAKHIWIAH